VISDAAAPQAWRSTDHAAIRAASVEDILLLLRESFYFSPEDWLERFAKKRENEMYHTSATLDEYVEKMATERRDAKAMALEQSDSEMQVESSVSGKEQHAEVRWDKGRCNWSLDNCTYFSFLSSLIFGQPTISDAAAPQAWNSKNNEAIRAATVKEIILLRESFHISPEDWLERKVKKMEDEMYHEAATLDEYVEIMAMERRNAKAAAKEQSDSEVQVESSVLEIEQSAEVMCVQARNNILTDGVNVSCVVVHLHMNYHHHLLVHRGAPFLTDIVLFLALSRFSI
jgi:hypothetical protein